MKATAKEIQLLGFAFFMGLLGNLAAAWLMSWLPEENAWWTGMISAIMLGIVILFFINRRTPINLDPKKRR